MRVLLVSVAMMLASTSSADIILNEWNGVGSSNFLDNGNSDTFFGVLQGNGGNWIEMLVVQDHADIRGWELRWYEVDANASGTAVWDPTRTVAGQDAQGRLIFSNDALWSDLRSGTLITISESTSAGSFDLSTDTSFNPASNDWRIHISTLFELNEASPLITTETNLVGDGPGNFSVGNNDWELTIVDELAAIVMPAVGEATGNWGGGGLNSREVGKFEFPEAPSTLADWLTIDTTFYRDGSSSSFGSENLWSSSTAIQDLSALREWSTVPEPSTYALLGVVTVCGMVVAARRRRLTV